ncbi:unnamed protein product [Haemonchus placei]|uniref:Phage integrase family protein n=1 Tax=Haemonchus placei TaxID=6290 RepID=A0A0N4X105_HAEPC|nr:unnamed protein product [Haemonchus placei]
MYLGRLISMDNGLRAEIMKRRRWMAMESIKEAAQLASDKKIRAELFDSRYTLVLPAFCYASDMWTENRTSELVLVSAQRAVERTMLKINLAMQRSLNLRSADIRSMTGIRNTEAGMLANTGSKPLKIVKNSGKRVFAAEDHQPTTSVQVSK